MYGAQVNFSPMLPKLVLTYPHRIKNRGIALAPLFLKLLLKAFHDQLRSLSNMTFSQIFWLFDFFCLDWLLPSDILVLMLSKMWFFLSFHYLWFKKSKWINQCNSCEINFKNIVASFETFFIALVKNLLKSGQGPKQETSSYQIWQIALW